MTRIRLALPGPITPVGTRVGALVGALLVMAAAPGARAERVCQPAHRTWTNSWVPEHCENRPDRRYVAPRNQPLDAGQAAQAKPATPPITVFTPAPQYDPYYGALGAALGPPPMRAPKPLKAPE